MRTLLVAYAMFVLVAGSASATSVFASFTADEREQAGEVRVGEEGYLEVFVDDGEFALTADVLVLDESWVSFYMGGDDHCGNTDRWFVLGGPNLIAPYVYVHIDEDCQPF